MVIIDNENDKVDNDKDNDSDKNRTKIPESGYDQTQ